jgi:hypothetical protein
VRVQVPPPTPSSVQRAPDRGSLHIETEKWAVLDAWHLV